MTQKNVMSARALGMEELEMVNGGKKNRYTKDPYNIDYRKKNPLVPIYLP